MRILSMAAPGFLEVMVCARNDVGSRMPALANIEPDG